MKADWKRRLQLFAAWDMLFQVLFIVVMFGFVAVLAWLR